MRPRIGLFHLIAALGAIGVLVCLYGAGSNFWTYFRMRNLPVEVVASQLRVDATTPFHSGERAEPYYVLDLHLKAENRDIHWEEELTDTAYVEEAADEGAPRARLTPASSSWISMRRRCSASAPIPSRAAPMPA